MAKSRYQTISDDLKTLHYKFRVNDLDEMLEYWVSTGRWMPFSKFTDAEIRTKMRELGYGVRGRKKPGLGEVEDCILVMANEARYNPIRDYLTSLDKVDYQPSSHGPYVIEQFARFFDNPDGMFGRWLFKWMTGSIAKAIEAARNPMFILVGAQKTGKSYFAKWLCPLPDHFLRDNINPDDKDSHLRLTDHFVWEVEELGATTRRADVESLKAFVTRDWVKKRPAFGKQLVRKPALCSFVGTVNNDGAGFLNDFTGTTRFLSCEVNEIDFDYTITDVNLLWAEAYHYYRTVPGCWELTHDEELKQAEINKAYEVPSALEEVISDLFDVTLDDGDFVTTFELKQILALHYRITSEQMFHRELARVLTRSGCRRGRLAYKKDQPHGRGWKGLKKKRRVEHE